MASMNLVNCKAAIALDEGRLQSDAVCFYCRTSPTGSAGVPVKPVFKSPSAVGRWTWDTSFTTFPTRTCDFESFLSFQ